MKTLIPALCVTLACLATVSATAVKVAPDKPQAKLYAYLYGSIDTSTHRATFSGASSPGCQTPSHKGIMTGGAPHTHDWQAMHTNGCSTSGNWWNADHTIWQLKRSWCGCEGWGVLNCAYGANQIKAWCYF